MALTIQKINRAYYDGELKSLPRKRISIEHGTILVEVDPLISTMGLDEMRGHWEVFLGNSTTGLKHLRSLMFLVTGSIEFPLSNTDYPLTMSMEYLVGEFRVPARDEYKSFSDKLAFPTLELIERLDKSGISTAYPQETSRWTYAARDDRTFELCFEHELDRTMFVMAN